MLLFRGAAATVRELTGFMLWVLTEGLAPAAVSLHCGDIYLMQHN